MGALGRNGGVIGAGVTLSPANAPGIWTPGEILIRRKSDTWPVLITDSDAQSWATKADSIGGTYTGAQVQALATFIAGLKTDGLWTKMKLFVPLCGNDILAASVIYKGGVWTTWASTTNTYTTAGLQASATTYTDTGFNTSTGGLTANNTHLCSYNCGSATLADVQTHIGNQDASNNGFYTVGPLTGGNNIFFCGQYNTTNLQGQLQVTNSSGNYNGMLLHNRTASNDFRLWRNGSQSGGTVTGSGGSLPNLNLWLCARNSNGSPIERGTSKFGLFSAGDSMTSTQIANYYTRTQTYQTSMGRNV